MPLDDGLDERLCGGFTLGSGLNALVGYLIKHVLKVRAGCVICE